MIQMTKSYFLFFSFFNSSGQEDNLFAKKNYDKYLAALKNSGLVSVEDKHQSSGDVGAEGGADALLGEVFFLCIFVGFLVI